MFLIAANDDYEMDSLDKQAAPLKSWYFILNSTIKVGYWAIKGVILLKLFDIGYFLMQNMCLYILYIYTGL